MNKNKLLVAAAGSGKTTCLVNKALEHKDKTILVTTYTQANEAEIRKKIIAINRCIPANIIVQTWFSFLLQHGVRPYQGCIFEKRVNGLLLVNSQSGLKFKYKGKPIYFSEEKEFEKHYFTNEYKIYSDKLSKFVFRCNEKTNGAVIDRISRIYSHIFIDEVQDLAGYDLELLKLFFKSKIITFLVGDPRQGTYSTNSAPKNKKFRKSEIIHFFEDIPDNIEIDNSTLTTNYRCSSEICDLSNKLFPDLQKTKSGNKNKTSHDGVYFIKDQDVKNYLNRFKPVQLRDNIKTEVDKNYISMNFGESKGLSFERVLIYPTKPFIAWLINNRSELAPTSRSKFYVAITRASQSVGIVYEYDDNTSIEGIIKFILAEN